MLQTAEIAEDVYQLPVLPFMNVWLLRDGDEWTLVDAAVPGTARRIVGALRGFGAKAGDLRRIVLTHCHPDHTGGVRDVRRSFGADVEVLAGEGDVVHLRDGTQPESDEDLLLGRVRNALPVRGPRIRDAEALGARLELAGGIDVVPTPGHSPGHVALHLTAHDLVIGGDVVFNVFRLTPPIGFFCSSVEGNRDSMLTIADLDPASLALSHGFTIDDDPAGRLRELAGPR